VAADLRERVARWSKAGQKPAANLLKTWWFLQSRVCHELNTRPLRNMEDADDIVIACTALVVCSLGAATTLAAKKKQKHSTWVKQYIRDSTDMVPIALCFQNWKPMIWVDTCSISGWTSVHSRNNKISNENPVSEFQQVRWLAQNNFFLHSVCLARARTNEPAANLLHQSRHIEIDAAG